MKKLVFIMPLFILLLIGVFAYHDSIPIVIKAGSSGYTNGEFSIRYTDFNLNEVNLYVNNEK